MKTVLVADKETLSVHDASLRALADHVQPRYSSHVVDALTQWFDSFRCDGDTAFFSRRGINFFGRRSSLRSLFFLLVYRGSELAAFAPLFRFHVTFGDGAPPCEVISFCPDSTIFFYNDILVREGCETGAVQSILAFFKGYEAHRQFIVLFNHMPSTSLTLPLLLANSMELPPHGFNVSISPVFRRGGLYPWNVPALQTQLEKALENDGLGDAVRTNIRSASDLLAGSGAMSVYRKNHGKLKSQLYRIFGESSPSDGLFDLFDSMESSFQSYPVKYPYLTLPRTADQFAGSLSSSRRYYYKRYRKQFMESGGEFARVKGRSIRARDIDDFMSLHRERWGRKSNILNDATVGFIFSFLRNMADRDMLTLFFAIHESKRIAAVCCIDFGRRREFFSSGRAPHAERLRAGKLLLYDAIVDAIGDGFSLFDFGYGDEAYKSDYDWSYITNNVVALFHHLHPKQCRNLFPLYEEVML